MVVPALGVAVPWCLLLVLVVVLGVPPALSLGVAWSSVGVAWSVRVERSVGVGLARPRPRLQGVAAALVLRNLLPVWGLSPRWLRPLVP